MGNEFHLDLSPKILCDDLFDKFPSGVIHCSVFESEQVTNDDVALLNIFFGCHVIWVLSTLNVILLILECILVEDGLACFFKLHLIHSSVLGEPDILGSCSNL